MSRTTGRTTGRTMSRIVTRVIVLCAIALAGCGGSVKDRTKPGARGVVKKLDPVNPKAAKAFEAAMRALRLGGPEAHETAKARLKEALAVDAKLWEAYYNLGVIAYRDGEDD